MQSVLEPSVELQCKRLCCGVQWEAASGSSEPHKHSSKHKHHKEHKQKQTYKAHGSPEQPAPEEAEPQGKPWLAEHILVKLTDKRLQGGRFAHPLRLTSLQGLTGPTGYLHGSVPAWRAQRLSRARLRGRPG